jgi:predicted nucleotidyltransferase
VERSALEAIARILRGLGIRFVLIGALAANRYRVTTRLTQDVDLLLADLGPGLEPLERALAAEGFALRRVDPAGAVLRLRHPELGAADLIVAATDYEREAICRARPEPLGAGGPVHVITPEDVIVLKLIAGRAQDLADIEAILAAGVALDEAYLEAWVDFWEVRELWQRLRAG